MHAANRWSLTSDFVSHAAMPLRELCPRCAPLQKYLLAHHPPHEFRPSPADRAYFKLSGAGVTKSEYEGLFREL